LRARRRAQPPSAPEPDARTAKRLEAFIGDLRLGVDLSADVALSAQQVFNAFEPAGIRALLLKGAGIAALLYEEGEQRPYVDLDLLVPPQDMPAAERVLTDLGYRNTTDELGIDDVGGVVHADTWRAVPPEGSFEIPVELHQWIPGARSAPEAAWEVLWRVRTDIDVGNRRVPVLDRPGQALQLALHLAQHGPEFRRGVAELRLALERWPDDVWREAAGLADQVGATDAFATGLRLVVPEGARLATTLGLRADPDLEWEISHQGERPRGAFHVEAFRGAAGAGERLALVKRALLPDSRWLATEFHWADRSAAHRVAANAMHLMRAPLWAARAWWFRRRARRRG
jgi:Uncharacterised nucleotidyltransferase